MCVCVCVCVTKALHCGHGDILLSTLLFLMVAVLSSVGGQQLY